MVRIINEKNIGLISKVVLFLLRQQEKHTFIAEKNNPNLSPCIYVMWHANQFLVHGIKNREHLNILISNSIDGEIVARTTEDWGFKVIRGSSGKKGAVESTMQMISRLKEGECVAIMIDGPHGPLHKVKNGALKIAQKTGAPIVPVSWFSPQKTFISLPSWDNMKTPLGKCKILNTYGTPIYINENATEEDFNNAKKEIKRQLFELETNANKDYNEALKNNLWKK